MGGPFRSERLGHYRRNPHSPDEKRVLDNFLRKMKDLDVISSDPEEGPGAYRFNNLLHSLYFFMEAREAPVPIAPDQVGGEQTEHGLAPGTGGASSASG